MKPRRPQNTRTDPRMGNWAHALILTREADRSGTMSRQVRRQIERRAAKAGMKQEKA